jgi:O-antigen ligase
MKSHKVAWMVKSREILALTIHVLLYLTLLTPLLWWSGFLIPHLTAKTLGFQILVELIAAGALITNMLEDAGRREERNPLFAPLSLALAAFLGYSFLTGLFGLDLNLSLWGFIDRQDGLVLLLHFYSWALVITWFFRREGVDSKKALKPLLGRGSFLSYLNFSFWISVVVALTAFGDLEVKFDGVISLLVQVLSSTLRPGGAFGNPLFLGMYLLFHFFYGLYFLGMAGGSIVNKQNAQSKLSVRRRALRWLLLASVAIAEFIILIVVLAGQTRGVLFGMIIGLVATYILFLFGISTRRLIRAVGTAFILCLLLVTAAAWHYRDSGIINRIPVFYRLTHIGATESASTYVRLLSWGSGLRGFSDHPLLGWGYNNVYYALNKYYDPRHIRSSPNLENNADTLFDKSHNYYIDLLVDRGILGLLAYVLLLGVVARSLYRMANRRLAICMAGGLIAYMVSNAVAFDTFGSLFGLFLTLACITALGDPESVGWLKPFVTRKQNVSGRKQPSQVKQTPVLGIGLILVLLSAGIYVQIEIAIANHRCLQAQTAFLQDPALGISFYQNAFEHFSPYSAKQKLDCAYLIVNSVIRKRQSSQSFDAGPLVVRLTREAVAAHPQDVDYYMALNDMFNGLALHANRDLARDAEAFGEKALELSPKRQEAMYHLGLTYLLQDQPSRAVELYRRMLQYAEFPLGRWVFGLSLLQNKQEEEGKREIRKAIEVGYRPNADDIATLKRFISDKEVSELTANR